MAGDNGTEHRDILDEVAAYLRGSGWIQGEAAVEFLAAGEYNENFLVTGSEGVRYVFRLNHGSQLGLENQIGYEFSVLQAVRGSGVTPVPYFVDPAPRGLSGGAMLMQYLPGRPLDYCADWAAAADIFAAIHVIPPPVDLVTQINPILSIAAESLALLQRFPDHPMKDRRARLYDYYQEIEALGMAEDELFYGEKLCIVNTEVNSHNFIIGEERTSLVDWEKAVVSLRYQDLGHFLAPTTTLWKSGYRYGNDEKRSFLQRYSRQLGGGPSLDELQWKTRLLERTVILRGLSWCFMAYYEYTATERPLKSAETFGKITRYLEDIDWFITGSLEW